MGQQFQRASLVPDGFAVEGVTVEGARVRIRLRSLQPFGLCPDCGRRSRPRHGDGKSAGEQI